MNRDFLDLVINESSALSNDNMLVHYATNSAAETALNHLVLDYLYKNGF